MSDEIRVTLDQKDHQEALGRILDIAYQIAFAGEEDGCLAAEVHVEHAILSELRADFNLLMGEW
jgi:hypothetical protein